MILRANSHARMYTVRFTFGHQTRTVYSDAGHGGIFPYHDQFVTEALEFLA